MDVNNGEVAKVPRNPSPTAPPGDSDLAALLGTAKPHWDALLSAASSASPACNAEWTYYASLKGWRCIIRTGSGSKGRALVHLRPDAGSFLASFALSDLAITIAEGLGVPREATAAARAGKPLPEGRPVRVQVRNDLELHAAVAWLKAKIATLNT